MVTLHKKYYASLLDCKTLDEAKEIYPEFQDVIDIRDLDLKKINSKILKQIARGDFEGLTKENASLEFLKKYVGQLIPVAPYSKDYFNLSHATARKLIGIFNISMDKRYRDVILSEKQSQISKEYQQDPQYRATMSESRLKALNTEEHELEAKIISIAKKLALIQYPFDVKLFEETEKEFPRIREILSKPEKALTDEEITYLRNFRKAKSKNREKIRKELNKIKKQILTRWSFYEKDRNLNVVLALALNSDPDNKKD